MIKNLHGSCLTQSDEAFPDPLSLPVPSWPCLPGCHAPGDGIIEGQGTLGHARLQVRRGLGSLSTRADRIGWSLAVARIDPALVAAFRHRVRSNQVSFLEDPDLLWVMLHP